MTDQSRADPGEGPEARRRRYRKPVLRVHGYIQRLTAAKRGRRFDGVLKPRTRLSIVNP